MIVDRKKDIVLWKKPLTTLRFFFKELVLLSRRSYLWLRSYYKTSITCLIFFLLYAISYHLDGFHQDYLLFIEKKFSWCCYWIGLGILSSVGLGTGLHTFILYLGPHIASVTLAAYECGSLKFPEPPYPDEIVCPDDINEGEVISVLSIMSKVRLEAFMWGAGTAFGELPPYFMAKAARLSGQSEEELENMENSYYNQESDKNLSPLNNQNNSKNRGIISKTLKAIKEIAEGTRSGIQILVKKVGFFGILACASIPNPLFDLAGITCGHFLVPFWTFFGATLIGKAIIKMHLQKFFVIVAFNEPFIETCVEKIKHISGFGKYLHEPFREFLSKQKKSLHRHAGEPPIREISWLASLFEKFVISMIIYFVISIINSMAQNNFQRNEKEKLNQTMNKSKQS